MGTDSPPIAASRRESTRNWTLGILGAVAILLAYVRVFHGEFLWDDDAHIYANPTIIGPLGLKEIWTSGKANYFPLTMTSFWVQHALWGLNPAWYHFVTLLFHIGAALMLWRVLVRLAVPGAWLGAMLWALHPVQVESVAWICELKNTQSAFFYLVAIYFFIRWIPRDATKPVVTREYVIAIVAAVLAILSKSSTVMLPVVLGLVGWWLGRRDWRDMRWLLPFLAVSILASAWTIWEQKVNSMASGPDWSHGLASRFMIAGKVPWFYLGKLLWPHPLIFIYPRWDVNALGLLHWIPLVATIAAVTALFVYRERARAVFVAFMVFGVSLFPVLGLFDVFFFKYSFVGDHFQYLASMGPLVLIGAGAAWLLRRWAVPMGLQVAVPAVLLALPALLTAKQTGIYLSRLALWRDTVARNPGSWIAQMNLGSEYMTTGQPALAPPHFEAALRVRPDDALAEANMGGVLYQLGKIPEAIPHLERSVHLMPSLAEAHNSLAAAYLAVGRAPDALAEFETALRLNPKFEGALINYGNALISVGRADDAFKRFQEGLRVNPNSAVLHKAVGNLLKSAGHNEQAVQFLQAAVRLDRNDIESLTALAEIFSRLGKYQQAVETAAAALQIRPDAPEPRYWGANALLLSGRAADAIPQYETVVRLRPDFLDARSNLGNALYQAGRAAEAVPHFAAIVQAQPKAAGAHNNLASALMQAGRLPDAIQEYREALKLEPEYVEARMNLALALEAAGQKKEAAEEYEAVLQRKPDHAAAKEKLQRLRSP